MKSKVVLILILFWLLPSQSFSQEKKPTISGVTIGKKTETDTLITVNSTFLLLGTLNDYISHNYVTKGNQFDRYYPYEKSLMRYVDSIAKKDFGIQLKEEKNCFISEELASKMNAFYDENLLKKSLFDSKREKNVLSFRSLPSQW